MALYRQAVLGALVAWSFPALAEPLDLSDPTPRPVRVEFEISPAPETIGQTWSVPFEGSYSASGSTATVVLSGPEYEAAVQTHDLDYFDVLMVWSVVAGSASSFQLDIDLTTLEVTAQPSSYEIDIQVPVQQRGTVTRQLDTTTVAGFGVVPETGSFPHFCSLCPPVPGAPFDPGTGQLNAIGSDALDAPDIDLNGFSRAGDLRLSEMPRAVPSLSVYGYWACALLLGALFAVRARAAAP